MGRFLKRNELVRIHVMGALGRVIVFNDKAGIVSFVTKKWKGICAESQDERGCMTAALSGGNTPVDIFKALAQCGLPWGNIQVFQVDERFVPKDDKDSNYRMIRETLLDTISMPKENIHFVDTSGASPDDAAQA